MFFLRFSCGFLVLMGILPFGDSTQAAGPNPTTSMIQATFKLVNQASTATCFLVRRTLPGEPKKKETILVTAAHVFQQMSGDDAKLVLRKSNPDGTFTRNEIPLKVKEKGKPLWTKHPKVDVAVLPIKLPEKSGAVPLPLANLADETALKSGLLATGDDVRIACYPVRFESHAAGSPVIRRGSVASYPLVPLKAHNTFLVDYNTFAGDSGGPVFIIDERAKGETRPIVVGLVLGMHLYDERTKLAFEERLQRHRMGLGIILQADFIKQTIDMLPKRMD